MVSVMNHVGPKKTSGFSIDSLLGNDVSKARGSPSPVNSVSSSASSENEPNPIEHTELKHKSVCHKEGGSKSYYQNVLRDRVPENSAITSCYGNKTTISSEHLPYLQNIENGILSRFQELPLPFHSSANILAHTNHINGHLSWLHQRHNGSPINWPGGIGGHLNSRFSGSETPLMIQHFRKPKRIRTAFSPSQLLRLEHAFEKNHYVVGQERKDLASGLGLSETQVKVWFQNRRTKYKRMKAEEEMTRTLAKKMKPENFQKIMYNNGIVSVQRSNIMSWHGNNIGRNNMDEQSDSESDIGV